VGIAHVEIADPSSIAAVSEVLDRAFALDAPSLIVFRRPCVLLERPSSPPLAIDPEACTMCGVCMKVGCPSIAEAEDEESVVIDAQTCTGCDVCAEVCKFDAIRLASEVSDD
jgi:indolepyruvate ferredoxin oxidoreductase alpha subunit